MAAGHEDTFHHVRDFKYFELPETFGIGRDIIVDGHKVGFGFELPLGLTKFMVMQVVAFVLVLLIFRGLAKRVRSGEPVKGRWWNFWEMLAVFIRDEVVRPTIGHGHHDHSQAAHGEENLSQHFAEDEAEPIRSVVAMPHAETGTHPADRYLPFVWSCFFYVLFCNLLGAIPWLGSATAEINVTGALAVVTFGMVIFYGSQESGFVGFWKSLVPGMGLTGVLAYILVPMIWAIELLGLFIKHGVLAVRLFANIMAGHTVIAVILGFIALSSSDWLYYLVLPSSILGQVAIGMLELFVSFLQAYIFAFLSALFISAAVNPH